MKTIVVTGGSRGIGRGLVEAFLARGCNVAFCSRSEESVKKTLDAIASDRLVGCAADVSKIDDLERLWTLAADRFGSVDAWINNAGTSNTQRDFVELPPTEISDVVGANLVGTMNGCHVALKHMRGQGRGHVFTMEGFGSDGAVQHGMSIYGSTKHAIRYLTKSLVLETRSGAVRVCSLSPGIVVTDLLTSVYQTGDPANWERARRFFNWVADPVETVAPWLADRVLREPPHGAHIAWMTVPKAMLRVVQPYYWKRELFPLKRPGT